MKFLSVTILLFLTLNINSCKSKKLKNTNGNKVNTTMVKSGGVKNATTTTTNTTTNNTTNSKIILNKDGYAKGIVVFNKQENTVCNYLIKLENGMLLEPQVFESKTLKTADKMVWIKYHFQRRMSRCGDATPVEIIDIKERN